MLALGLLLALATGCGSAEQHSHAPARAAAAPRATCPGLARGLTHLAPPTTMHAQRRGLARLATTQAALRRRFSIESARAVVELSASLRAEHESISARLDGRITASRRLHAAAVARYARGAALARVAAASCP